MSQFVGRVELLDAASRVARGSGTRAALVIGEPGSGKSRLLREVVTRLPSSTVLDVTGHEPEQVIPWAATGRLLAELASRDDAVATALAGHRGAALLVLEAAHRALTATAGPVVLVVDDAQWLDAYSRALLHYLARAAHQDGSELLLLVAGRPERATDELYDSLLSVLPAQSVASLEVGPLSREEGIQLMRAVRPDVDEEVAVRQWRLAAGSPFWLSLLAQTDDASATLGVVRSRLRASGADAVTVLGRLAVAGRPLPVAALESAPGWSGTRVRAAVGALVHANLAIRTGDRLAVVHDLVREIVVADLGVDARRSHDVALADWFARDDDPSALLLAAQHLAAAGGDPVHLANRAATCADRHRLGVDGLTQLVRICEATTHPGSVDLALRLAELATAMREPAIAQGLWQRVAEEHPDEALRRRAARESARAAYQLGDRATARLWLGRARDLAAGDALERIHVDVLDCHVSRWMEGRFAAADGAAASAWEAAQRLDPADPSVREVVHEILQARSDGALMAADYQTMESVSRQMAQLANGDAEMEYTAAVYRIDALLMMEKPLEAERIARRHWASARESGHPTRALEMGADLVDALLEQGRGAEAAAVLADVGLLLARVGDLGGRITTGGGMPTVSRAVHWGRALTGDWPAARHALEQELDAGGTHLAASSLLMLAGLDAWLGTPVEGLQSASRLAERSLAAAGEVGCARCTEEARVASARLRGFLGDVPGARTLLDAVRSGRPSEPAAPVLRQLRWADAALLAAEGETVQAADGLRGLREEYAARGLHLSWLFAGLDLAEVLARGSPKSAALDVLDEVASAAGQLSVANVAASADLRMRRLGARPWRRGSSSGAGLSDRERAVVDLLATGASNPEIAAALFLSRKTVERHVSNIIAKLGVRNRAEVVACMVPRGAGQAAVPARAAGQPEGPHR